MVCNNIGVNTSGHLTLAGQDTTTLASQYGTPLYLMDEDRIRYNCRLYKNAMRDAMGEGSFPLFASKAACFKRIFIVRFRDDGIPCAFRENNYLFFHNIID